ncbi:MAG: hypothetical protein FJ395_20155 [Verrucomicrobia bacterium]|nr:hypothetical protein [Verrucomicrobiota bacterium]
MKAHTILTVAMLVVMALGCKPSAETPKAEGAAFAPLTGRWARTDGGYMLMVHRVEADGKANVGYFNPNAIRVSQAQATAEGGVLKLFVELRDEGYPGCTYRLTYDKAKNQLFGVYYQAAQQQSYDIVFERAQ